MKKKYIPPVLEILILETADIITASGEIDNGNVGTGGGSTGGNTGILDGWED